jgi:ubiquinone/menaquinone biosynthesis C-methylase UbiE
VGRTWDAATYERLADWQGREGLALVEQLGLRGDETVLDAGCGTGRLTRHLVERLPRGRVIAVDVSPAMLDEARRRVDPSRVELVLADLAEPVLEQLPAELRDRFFTQVLETQPRPYASAIQKLHLDARRAPQDP